MDEEITGAIVVGAEARGAEDAVAEEEEAAVVVLESLNIYPNAATASARTACTSPGRLACGRWL
jgi:hypothetical protein